MIKSEMTPKPTEGTMSSSQTVIARSKAPGHKTFVFTVLACVLLIIESQAQWVAGYTYKSRLTINGSQVCGAAALTDFPILIQLSGTFLRSSAPGLISNANGYDIIFTASDQTTILQHQIDNYNGTTGTYAAWVKIPSLPPGSDTDIYMYYGNSSVTLDPSTQTTWSANFRTIYHFQNNNFNDATANALNGTNIGSTPVTVAKIGEGRDLDGTDDYIQSLNNDLATANNFTLSIWFKADATAASHIFWQGDVAQNGWGNGAAGGQEMNLSMGRCCPGSATESNYISWFLGDREEQISTDVLNAEATFTNTTTWQYAVATISNLNTTPEARLYLNGALISTNAGVVASGFLTRAAWNTNLRIGRPGQAQRYFNGQLDEARVATIVRPPEWICTEFNNQNNPGTFSTLINRAPDLTTIEGTTINYTEGDAATNITSTIAAADWDNATFTGATIQITSNYVNGEDVLAFTSAFGVTGTFNATTGTLALSGTTTIANYVTLLRSVTYQNTNNGDPSNGTRTVSFSVNDGTNTSNVLTRNITVADVNDAPVLAAIEGTALAYSEGQAATAVTATTTAADVDNANLTGATVQIITNYANGEDVLAFTAAFGITGSFNAATGTLTLSGTTTVANYQSALRAVTYQNTNNNNPSALTRTVRFIATDGSLSSTPITRNIAFTAVNDNPVLAAIEGTALAYSEGQAATIITATTTVADVDNANLASAAIQITGNYVNGEDVLAFTNAFSITGAFNATTGTLTLTGPTTLANFESAIRTVTYQNTNNNNPSALTRTVSFTVNDGTANSNTVTRNITFTAVNDNPVLAAIEGAALAYSESQAATIITATTTVADVDNANLANATIQITGNYANGEDVLAFTNAFSITGSFNTATGTLTLTGPTTLANFESAIRTVTYQNTNNNNPSALTRTVSFTVNDGAVNSNTVTRNIAFTAVNDNPVLAAIEAGTLAYSEGQAATVITATTTVADVDNANLASAAIQITGNYVNGEDVLAFTNAFSITGSFNAATGTLTLTGPTTLANFESAIRSVTYQNTNNNNPSALTRTVSFTVNDGSANSNTVTRNIAFTAVNDNPVLAAIEAGTLAYSESQAATIITATTTVADVDNANLTSATIQITGNYANGEDVLAFTNAFSITGSFNAATGTMTLTGPTTLANFQSAIRSVSYQNTNNNNPSAMTRTVSFTVNDGAANSNTVTRDIAFTAVNDNPVLAAIEGTALAYSEGQAATVITATTTVADVDNANLASATIQITGNYVNGEDVLAFTNAFSITGAFNAATGTMTLTGPTTLANFQSAFRSVTYQNTNNNNPSALTRTVSFTVNDGSANSNTVTRNITFTAVNDNPVLAAIEGTALAYSEGQAATAITTTTTVSDVDNANLASATIQITGNYVNGEDVLAFTNAFSITGSFNAATGTMTLTGPTTLANFQSAIRSVTYQNTNNNNPSALTRTVSFTVNDGSANSNTVTRDIAFTAVNDNPVLAAMEAGALAYTESQAATVITATTTVADVDNANLASATIQITGNYTNGEDVLAFTNAFSITGSFNAATGTMTLTGPTTLANFQSAVRSVTYQNTNNNNPSSLTRTVSFTVNDGSANSNTVTRNITFTAVNDNPVLAAIEAGTLSYSEGQAATIITATTTVADVDNPNLASATIQITGNYVNGEDVLAFTNAFSITGSFNAATGAMTLTGPTTLANFQSAIRAVTYQNTNNANPSVLTRTVSFTVNDGAANSNTVTRDIAFTAVNDNPVLAAMEAGALAYTESQAATIITATTTVADVDNANLASATIQITGNYANGEDVLAFTNAFSITGSFNAATGTLTLTGPTTLANFQSAIRTVTYQNTNNNNPSALTRTVSFTVNDGAANSNTVTRNITFTAVNDNPVLAAIEAGTLAYSEGQAATIITATTTVADVDNTNLASATIQITGNYVNGEDVLTFTNAFSITGSFNAATGTMTLTGPTTLANFQSAIRAVTYQNTNNANPSVLTRTVSFTVNDGAANSNTITRDIAFTAVNDAPVLAAIEVGALTYSEGQAATVVTATTTVADVDNANLTSATVQITTNYVNGEDVLAFSTAFGITGSFNAATGTLTLSGTTTLTNYQSALRAVTYQNTNNNNPSAVTRTVSLTVNDGTVNSNTVTRDIIFTAVNDSPVLAAIEAGALTYSEGQAATVITATTTVADVDNTNLTGATVQITANYASGEDVLAFTAAFGITGTFNAASGTLTLSGTTTLANYQAALRAVTYENTNTANPSASTRTVSFTVNDGTANSNTVTRNITFTTVNDAPVLAAIEGTSLPYAEGQAATIITATTTVADGDNANLTSATIQVTGNYVNGEDVLAFTNAFSITGSFNAATGTLTLTGPTTLANFQSAIRSVTYQNTNNANPSVLTRTVSFTVNDGSLNSNTITRSIAFTAGNDAPVLAAIEGTALSYSEGQVATVITSTTTVADVDNTTLTGATIQITTNYANGEDVLAFATAFGITGTFNAATGTLTLTGTTTLANYQSALRAVTYQNTNTNNPSALTRTVSFTVNDGIVNSNSVTRDITFTVVNDAPVLAAIEAAAMTYSEGQVATAITATTTVTDVDNTNLTGATVQITSNYVNGEDVLAFTAAFGITGSFNATTGTLTLTGTTTVANYQSALRAVTFQNTNNNNPSVLTRTVSFTVNDGTTNSNTVTRDVTFTAVNDAPVLASTEAGALTYTEGQAATAITSTTTVADVDNTNLTGATVQITANYVNGEDVLAFTAAFGITGTFNATTGTLTLTGTTTIANYQSALRAITYQNTNNSNPSALTRTVSFTVNDGTVNSNTVTRNIAFTLTNDAPVLAAMETGTLSYSEGQVATAITATTTVADVDNTNLTSATIQITTGYVNGEDVLAFTAAFGITGSFNAATGILTLTGTTTLANYQSALRAVTYQNTNNNNPSASTRTVSFTVNDGTVNSNTVTRDITFTTINDAPILAAIEAGALAYAEGQAATIITSTTTVTDVDNINLSSATVQVSANYVNGEDVLNFTSAFGITGSFDAASGILTLTGNTTVANYQSALRAVTYQNTNNSNPSAATRTISFTVNDGAINSNTIIRNITFTAVNDAPVLAAIEGSDLNYSEGDAATVITLSTTVTDPDNTTIAGATISITANYSNGADVLAFTNAFGITGSFNAATGVLTLTGSASLANYQDAIRSVTYQNTNNNNPSVLTRTISFVVNDGAVNSNVVTRNILFTAVNDAPVAVNDNFTTAEDTFIDIVVTTNDTDVDNGIDPTSVTVIT
ncbi:MAG TPA: DUF2341 domain-containing protein, partial [Ohtaekwangia sp.]